MKKFRLFIYIIFVVLFSSPIIGSQFHVKTEGYELVLPEDSILVVLNSKQDTIVKDSITNDTIPQKKNALDAPVDYSANDSIIFTSGNWAHLYGDAHVSYKDIGLKAEKITMNLDSSIVYATFGLDSVGAEFGHPVFTDGGNGGSEFEAKTIRYNFKTKKGYVTHVLTQQGEGYIVAEKAKKNSDDSFFMQNAQYTTCDQHDHPHFYLMLTEAKIRPKKNIIAGPSYLVIEDVPIYFIGLPFGFFPFTNKYSSGVIMPSYVDELNRGFGLRDGGYYFAINDFVDLALTGEVFTRGSWGLDARTNYRNRYKYSGNASLSYRITKFGEKGDPDYNVGKDFSFVWGHTQDPKANMYRTISASVNFSTSTYNRNDLSSQYNLLSRSFTENTKNSTVTITQRFPNSPFTLSANLAAAQISRDSTVSLTMPNLTIAMASIFPFKRKNAVGTEHWYEKIRVSYTGMLKNSITTKEDKLFNSSLTKDWSNGMKHTVPVNAAFNIFKYLNISPSFNYNERWYTQRIRQKWDAGQQRHVNRDTLSGFARVYDFNYALNFQTRLYGFYEPIFKIPFFGRGKIDRIRHVFTPSISFNGQPDFSDPRWGFFESYEYYNPTTGAVNTHTYSPYSQGIFGAPSAGQQGNISFGFENNLEMKIKTKDDSTRIISLIDNLGINFSYNMRADSLKWSDIQTTARFKLSKSLIVNLNAIFDPYMYNENGQRINKLRIQNGRGIARLRSTSYAISPSINQDTFKKWFGKGDKSKNEDKNPNPELNAEGGELNSEDGTPEKKGSLFDKPKDSGEYDDDGYLKNEIKWNLAANYSFSYGYSSDFDVEALEFRRKLTHNLGFSGSIQPTKNWNFTFNTSYDFTENKLAYVSCSLVRNLHCWSISANFRPVGPYQSYFVSIRANSSLLQDLKYDKRGQSSSFDPEWF